MRSPLFTGVIYLLLGGVFTVFAIQQVTANDWNFFAYILIIIATFDFVSGFRLISRHFKAKRQQKK